MRRLPAVVLMLFGLLPLTAHAHRLDEYLQATILSISADHVDGTIRLVPGVAVYPQVIGKIDRNHDGFISTAEQQAYASKVLHDLYLALDGQSLDLRLMSASWPSPDLMKQGLGKIQISFRSDFASAASTRTLIFENHHEPAISVYLVNTLLPEDANVHLGEQLRNRNQSNYVLHYSQGSIADSTTGVPSFSGFSGAFHLGVRHIAEGTDHLLFLLTLLLPAPLLAFAGGWSGIATVKHSLAKIVRIVTAFTVGHSLTLLLSAFGLLHLPSRLVEVLIAVSILISALHAVRPLFPGREAFIAAGFGLVHGAAFASALADFGFGHWYRLVTVLGFNMGIEAMQLVVVGAVLPSLLLLSRTPFYKSFRVGGATLSIVAATGWIVERSFQLGSRTDQFARFIAANAFWLASTLLLASLICFLLRRIGTESDLQTKLEREVKRDVDGLAMRS